MSNFPISSASLSSNLSSSPVVDNASRANGNVIRNTVMPGASIWGDQFLTYDEPKDFGVEKQVIEELKKEVRNELMIKASDEFMQHKKLIELIDAVQRLGIAYHFEEEIDKALKHIYVTYGEQWVYNIKDLHSISLWFRLLRQQGFNISSEIFMNHMDEKGNFRESLCTDAQGMLALYEAAYMRVEGEQILDKALKFTKIHLGKIVKDPSCDSFLRTLIQQALKQPLRKRLPRLEAARYIPIYQQENSHNELLLKLAKLDFNMLQSMHKKELSQICKWWKDLDMQNKLPYVRDRLVEGYFWIVGVYPEPHHSRSRKFLIKTSMWLVVMDDTFDNYATYDELEIFTEAVERWSISCLDVLPEYMKLIYQELLNMHSEMEESIEKEGKSYQIHYVKEMAKEYTRSLLKEAKWLNDGYMPTLDEHIGNSLVTGGYPVIIARSYVGGGDMVNEETFKWVATFPPVVKASCLIIRLMNDIATHKEEQERNHGPSSIECYQKEFGASEEEACQFFSNQVEEAWKVMNRESLGPTHVPFPVLMPPINFARACDVIYKDNDSYKHAGEEMINHIKSFFVHPMVI
uniref:(E)-beta-farnesene synthase-like n=1 Tax=Erigeron canadensis TaxID=72917 RepID=UPI001CB8E247|nr:(E)-beta-farnesene synthase-like [Erigeron canadensis]